MALDYSFDKGGMLSGMEVFASYTDVRALQESEPTSGRDVPFYSRNIDAIGLLYLTGQRCFNIASTYQSCQFSDNANTVAENASGSVGEIPGFCV
jgi:Fe(3+) dicitrate transport protein